MAFLTRLSDMIIVCCAVAFVVTAAVSIGKAAEFHEAIEAVPSTVELADAIADWPTSYTVTATKSEPGYVEHITTTRDGDHFALQIVIEAQGTHAGGSSRAEVVVAPDGTVSWISGCTATNCADDDAVRGFLAGASLLSASREERLPATGTVRTLGAHQVVCVADGELFPATAARALARLDPCFSLATGAVIGHYSLVNHAFLGPTMSAGSIEESLEPDLSLLTPTSP